MIIVLRYYIANIFQIVSCLHRWYTNTDSNIGGAIAGGIAGLGFVFNPSNTVALYAVWKVLEVN